MNNFTANKNGANKAMGIKNNTIKKNTYIENMTAPSRPNSVVSTYRKPASGIVTPINNNSRKKFDNCNNLIKEETWGNVLQKGMSAHSSFTSLNVSSCTKDFGDKTENSFTEISAINPLLSTKYLLNQLKTKLKNDYPDATDLSKIVRELFCTTRQIECNLVQKQYKHKGRSTAQTMEMIDKQKDAKLLDISQLEGLTSDYEQLKKDFQNVSETCKNLEEKLNAETTKNQNLKIEISTLQNQLEEKQKDINVLESDRTTLQIRCESIQNIISQSQEQILSRLDVAQNKIEDVNMKLLMTKMEKDKYSSLVDIKDEKIKRLTETFEEIKKLSLDNLVLQLVDHKQIDPKELNKIIEELCQYNIQSTSARQIKSSYKDESHQDILQNDLKVSDVMTSKMSLNINKKEMESIKNVSDIDTPSTTPKDYHSLSRCDSTETIKTIA